MRRTQQAHEVVAGFLRAGHCAIDATAGNGHDTLFLARQVGRTGRVFGFDVQNAALAATRRRLRDHDEDHSSAQLPDVTLYAVSHADMAAHIPAQWHGRVAAIMFNLGYLPGCDHTLTTNVSSTLGAIDSGRRLLAPGGVLSVLSYPGHAAGNEELEALLKLIGESSETTTGAGLRWHEHDPRAAPQKAPRLFIAQSV